MAALALLLSVLIRHPVLQLPPGAYRVASLTLTGAGGSAAAGVAPSGGRLDFSNSVNSGLIAAL